MKKTVCLVVVPLLVAALSTSAQGWSRKGKSELWGIYRTLGGSELSISGQDLKFEDSTVYGVAFGGNAYDNFGGNLDFLFGQMDCSLSDGSDTVTDTETVFLVDLNFEYNVLNGPLTPVAEGGVGLFWFFGDIIKGAPFSYNLGAGVRYDVTDNLSVKALYQWLWTSVKSSWGDSDTVMFDGFTFSLALMF